MAPIRLNRQVLGGCFDLWDHSLCGQTALQNQFRRPVMLQHGKVAEKMHENWSGA